jgi:hypothetical protein
MRRLSVGSFVLVLGVSTIHCGRARAAEPGVVAPSSPSATTPVVLAPQTRDGADLAGADGASDASRANIVRAPQPTETDDGGTETAPRSHWYGWQTAATDGAAVALLATGIAAESGELAGFSGATFALGGPIVHLAHGRGGAAAASLGIRVGLATSGFFAGAAMKSCPPSSSEEEDDSYACGLEAAAIGMLVGAGAAMVIDTAFLTHEDIRPERPQRTAALSVSPAVSVTKSSGTVGLAGAF